MSQVGSIMWRIILCLAFIITLNTGYCSQSTVNKNENGLKHMVAANGLQGNTRTKASGPLKLHQRPYPVETYDVEKGNTLSMLELQNRIRRDDAYQMPQAERRRHYSDVNKIPEANIHDHDEKDDIVNLVNVSTRSARREASQKCQKLPVYVNFRSIGWVISPYRLLKWIHSPKGYNSFACQGYCGNPRDDPSVPSYAKVQALMNTMQPTNIANLCCVPTKLSSLNVEYFSGRNKTRLTLQDIVVEECGCR